MAMAGSVGLETAMVSRAIARGAGRNAMTTPTGLQPWQIPHDEVVCCEAV